MNFDQLKTFLTVVETGSFQKAAQNEYISQRAVSQSMQKLETELGFTLFKRGKNKIYVTSQGEEFYLKTKDMLHSFDIEVNFLRHQTISTYREIKIGYFSPFEGALLRHQIYTYKQTHPKVIFKITEESIEHLISDVSLGLLDVAYILDYGAQEFLNNNLANQTIYQNQMIVGISKLHHLHKLAKFPLAALKEKPILYYSSEKSNYLKQAFLATLPKTLKKLSIARISTIEQMQTLVTANQAIAYYPAGLIEMALNTKADIKYLPIKTKENTQDFKIQAIYKKQDKKIKLINEFLDSKYLNS